MKIKDIYTPIVLIAAGAAFIFILILVFLTNGRSRKLIASKLRIGAFLLSFGWLVTSCSTPTCYAPAEPENSIRILPKKGNSSNELYNYLSGDTLSGYIHEPTFYFYSFQLVDSASKQIKQAGELIIDSTLYHEKMFHFILGSNLTQGTFEINYFGEDSLKSKKIELNWIQRIYIK
ncbi:MAG: hypothetical protein NT007_01600 [Candidatus Kapabacteria bacterium]|nr:hypothetical protein [Candidatus Kapabacteria bacterium]